MIRHCRLPILLGFWFALTMSAAAQQRADTSYQPEVADPRYPPAAGPRVAVDAGHHNFHTAEGRYAPFAALLRADGFQVAGHGGAWTPVSLAEVDILVVANALAEANVRDWSNPVQSAFSKEEIEVLIHWVTSGGRLLLIADHMPFPGAAATLAQHFGVIMENGFVFGPGGTGTLVFKADDGTLGEHPITRDPAIPFVVSFTGQGFTIDPAVDAEPLLVIPPQSVLILPQEAWVFEEDTPRRSAGGMLQGATIRLGEGRVVVFGEAAMFTSQTGEGGQAMGLNHPSAPHNEAFVLNVLHWLSEDLTVE